MITRLEDHSANRYPIEDKTSKCETQYVLLIHVYDGINHRRQTISISVHEGEKQGHAQPSGCVRCVSIKNWVDSSRRRHNLDFTHNFIHNIEKCKKT